MKRIAVIFVLMMLVFAPSAFSQTLNSTASGTSTVGIVSNPSINQEFKGSDPGQGRWFIAPPQPYNAPVLPYLGPWSSGANIIEDLRVLPEVITREQALKMYKGGVEARISKMADFSYQFETCKLMNQLPMKELLANDGKPIVQLSPVLDPNGKAVLDKDGKPLMQQKPVMVPDESKFKKVAYIFLQGDEKATTVDVIAKAVIEATNENMGVTGIYLVKKVTSTATRSTGWGIGASGVAGQLGGQGATNSQAGAFGTGYNRATAEPLYKEGIVVLAVQE
jgi:hypothetical protein